jgi:hypothetical protein
MAGGTKKHTYCEGGSCNIAVMNPYVSSAISYCVSAAVLAKPIFNAAGADTKNILSIIHLNSISLTAVGLILAVILCGYISAAERHANALFCAIHACGIPGVILAFFTVALP